jgi:hypothetical protein
MHDKTVTIMERLMAVQTAFPGMRWDFNDWGGISFHVVALEPHEIQFLTDARKMFEPA